MAYIDDKLGRGEKVIYRAHQHWAALVRETGKWLLLFFAALAIAIVVNLIQPLNDFWGTTARMVLNYAALAVCLVSFVAFGWAYLQWFTEQYILTNDRIIQVEGIINKNLKDSSLDKINDVQVNQSVFGRMLGYADIDIQTGNESQNLMRQMADPFEFKKRMLDAKNGYYGDASAPAPLPQVAPHPQPSYNPVSSAQPPFSAAPAQKPYQQAGGYAQAYEDTYSGSQAAPNPQDIPALIAQLAKLRDSGVISESEFQQKKNDLLRRM